MADLRATCESVGCTEVATYIQSGNVVLASALDAPKLRAALEAAIAERIGVSTAVLIRTGEDLAQVVAGNPFPSAEPTHLHVAFLDTAPSEQQVASLGDLDFPPEEVAVRGTEAYFHLPHGIGRAKLPEQVGRRIRTVATVRNWRTVNKLVEMSAK